MANTYSSRLLLLLCVIAAGCDITPLSSPPELDPEAAVVAADSNPDSSSDSGSPETAVPPGDVPATPPTSTPYADAINRASAASSVGQSARSKDDWRLAASRWQQAIALLESVPADNPNAAEVPQKLAEYRQNLAYAQQQADIPIPEAEPGRVVLVPAQEPALPTLSPRSPAPSATPRQPQPRPASNAPSAAPASPVGGSSNGQGVFQAPIVRRAGGTPVILATFNGSEPFEMIVDTGASGTVITQPMARALSVESVGEARVSTASASNVPFQLGYVSSLEVAGARINNLLVAIAGPELSTGLLGQDFFSGYDVTVRQDVVEFHER